jgi:hypothetical protein
MPSPRRPLPQGLEGTAFTVAQGRSIGLGQARMRGGDLIRPFWGVRVTATEQTSGPSPADPGELLERCLALSVVLPPGAFFSHLTAARLWPLDLPTPDPQERIHVGVRRPARPPRRFGVTGHLIKDPLSTTVWRRGLPLVDPATLFCQLAGCQLADMLTLHDLVAVGDALILRPVFADAWEERPWVSLRELRERVEIYHGRGKQAASRAIRLVRQGAESRPETLLRLAIMDAGLPEPEVNPDIRDAGGRFIGRGDLVYRRWLVIVEYDGEHHRRSTKQFDRDVRRLEDFANNGWHVVRIVGRSFFGDRVGSMARVRRALTDAGWRP